MSTEHTDRDSAAGHGFEDSGIDDATRIVRRREGSGPLDEETRIVARTVAPEQVPDNDGDGDFDESTRIVDRAASAAGSKVMAEDEEDESTLLEHRGLTPVPSDAADITSPGRRRVAPAPLSPAAPSPGPAVPSPAADTSLSSGGREIYAPRPLPEQQPLQRMHVEATHREHAVADPHAGMARRVALTVLVALVGTIALGVVIAAIVLLVNAF